MTLEPQNPPFVLRSFNRKPTVSADDARRSTRRDEGRKLKLSKGHWNDQIPISLTETVETRSAFASVRYLIFMAFPLQPQGARLQSNNSFEPLLSLHSQASRTAKCVLKISPLFPVTFAKNNLVKPDDGNFEINIEFDGRFYDVRDTSGVRQGYVRCPINSFYTAFIRDH